MTITSIVLGALTILLLSNLVWLGLQVAADRRRREETVREERLRIRHAEFVAERKLYAVTQQAMTEMMRVAREEARRGGSEDR